MSNHYEPDLFPQLPEASELEIRALLEPHYPLLWQVLMAPWNDLQERRQSDAAFRRRTKGSLAWWLQPEMVHQAELLFGNHAIRPEWWRNGQFVLRYQDKVVITIKKVKKQWLKSGLVLCRSNYLTPTNKHHHAQRRCGPCPDIPRVILGWLPVRLETEISVVIAYPRSESHDFQWWYEMPDQSGMMPQLAQQPPEDPSQGDDSRGFTITPKRGAGEGANDGRQRES